MEELIKAAYELIANKLLETKFFGMKVTISIEGVEQIKTNTYEYKNETVLVTRSDKLRTTMVVVDRQDGIKEAHQGYFYGQFFLVFMMILLQEMS